MDYKIALEVEVNKRFIVEVEEERFIKIHKKWLESGKLERMDSEYDWTTQGLILVTTNILCFLRECKSLEQVLKSPIIENTLTNLCTESPEGENLEDYIPYLVWKEYITDITWDRLKELKELRKKGRR